MDGAEVVFWISALPYSGEYKSGWNSAREGNLARDLALCRAVLDTIFKRSSGSSRKHHRKPQDRTAYFQIVVSVVSRVSLVRNGKPILDPFMLFPLSVFFLFDTAGTDTPHLVCRRFLLFFPLPVSRIWLFTLLRRIRISACRESVSFVDTLIVQIFQCRSIA